MAKCALRTSDTAPFLLWSNFFQLKWKAQTRFLFLFSTCSRKLLTLIPNAISPLPWGLGRQTQHHYSKFLIKKQLNAPGQLEMQIMSVWFTGTGDSFVSAQVRSPHLFNSYCKDKVSYSQLKTSELNKVFQDEKNKIKWILEEEVGSEALNSHMILPYCRAHRWSISLPLSGSCM